MHRESQYLWQFNEIQFSVSFLYGSFHLTLVMSINLFCIFSVQNRPYAIRFSLNIILQSPQLFDQLTYHIYFNNNGTNDMASMYYAIYFYRMNYDCQSQRDGMRISTGYKCQSFQFTYKINDDESDDEIITTATSSGFAVSF